MTIDPQSLISKMKQAVFNIRRRTDARYYKFYVLSCILLVARYKIHLVGTKYYLLILTDEHR